MSAVARVRAAFVTMREANRPEAWISIRPEAEALDEARSIDRRVADGETLPLAGLVAAVKDNIDVAGLPTTAGAPTYSYEPTADATAVVRLRAAGAVVLGKTNLDQFATGINGTRSPFGAVRNAWDADRISGGSSSGSAVAVALGVADFALGTDTAGSGRVPAALNGIWGLKPTRGVVPNTGVVPACRSLDCVTVFAREFDLARRVVRIMAGPDSTDPLARVARAGPQVLQHRIAVPTTDSLGILPDSWAAAFATVVRRAVLAGFEVIELDITPLLEAAELLYGGAFVAERYAAVGAHIEQHAEAIGSDIDATVAAIVLDGARPSAAELFDDLERLDAFRVVAARLFAGVDCLLTPTTTSHPLIAEVLADPVVANSKLGRFTNFANLLDMCSLAVPAGTADGLPFGVMLTAPAFSDDVLGLVSAELVTDEIDVLVVGAHLSGQPLNHQLIGLGARLRGEVNTAPLYRLFALETEPPKPALVGSTEGVSIVGEVWRMSPAAFGAFVALIPAPLAIGTVTLAEGETVKGFVGAAGSLGRTRDISAWGGWSAWRSDPDRSFLGGGELQPLPAE